MMTKHSLKRATYTANVAQLLIGVPHVSSFDFVSGKEPNEIEAAVIDAEVRRIAEAIKQRNIELMRDGKQLNRGPRHVAPATNHRAGKCGTL